MMVLTSRAEFTLAEARARLRPKARPTGHLPLLIAAALAATTALGLAAAVILGPPAAAIAAIVSAST